MSSSRTTSNRRPGTTRPAVKRTTALATIDSREPWAQRSTDRLIGTHEARSARENGFNSSI